MPAYDASFNPPAPVANVTVSHPVTGVELAELGGKLDTGADVTVIPEQLAAQLNLSPKGHIWTHSYDGAYSQRPVYLAKRDPVYDEASVMKKTTKKIVRETVGGEPYEYYPVGRHIVIAPGVCGGRPTFKYTRIDVRHALRLVAGGHPIESVARGYQIPVAAVREALALAAPNSSGVQCL